MGTIYLYRWKSDELAGGGQQTAETETLQEISALNVHPDVGFIHPNWHFQLAGGSHIPPLFEDPLYGDQWSISGFEGPSGFADPLGAHTWWTIGSASVNIGILDTGRTDHPDLINKWHPTLSYNAVYDDPDATDNGNWAHGTMVASIIGAEIDNGVGMHSYCPLCTLVPIKVTDDSNNGQLTVASIIAGIDWAASNGIRVLNMSLEYNVACSSPSLAALSVATTNAYFAGVNLVAAAGNQADNASGFSPASCPGVISVAALDQNSELASYSNYGSVSLAAPAGGGVFSSPVSTSDSGFGQGIGCPNDNLSYFNPYTFGTIGAWRTSPSSGGVYCYRYMSGTSFAAPVVSGTIGLMLSLEPFASPVSIQQSLGTSAMALGPTYCQQGCGAGLVDPTWAVWDIWSN